MHHLDGNSDNLDVGKGVEFGRIEMLFHPCINTSSGPPERQSTTGEQTMIDFAEILEVHTMIEKGWEDVDAILAHVTKLADCARTIDTQTVRDYIVEQLTARLHLADWWQDEPGYMPIWK
jgi:hypothetical protein